MGIAWRAGSGLDRKNPPGVPRGLSEGRFACVNAILPDRLRLWRMP